MNKKRIFDIEKLLAIEEPCPPQFAPGFDERARRRYLLESDDFWLAIQTITIATGKGLEAVASALYDIVLLDDIDHVARLEEIDIFVEFRNDGKSGLQRHFDVIDYGYNLGTWLLDDLHPYVKWFRRDYSMRRKEKAHDNHV